MATIYVARSKSLSEWGGDVGLSKNLFKLGVFEGGGKSAGKDAVAALNEEKFAGVDDWALLKAEDAGELTDEDAIAQLARKQPIVDPKYYPRIRGAAGIFRIKPKDIENSMLVQRALAGEESLNFSLKPADIAAFLIRNAGVGE
jgi:hypothetical protein